jgi:hypothetical protein
VRGLDVLTAELQCCARYGQEIYIDDWSISIYMREIVNQANYVQLAAGDINQAISQPDSNSVTRAFLSVQSILAASSMISKLLEPNPDSLDREGNKLTGDAELSTFALFL